MAILNYNIISFKISKNSDKSPLIKLSIHQLFISEIPPQKLFERHAVRSVNHTTDVLDSDLLNLYLGDT